MQRAIVKSISVKEGDNTKGHWINTQITTTDGAKLGSFEHGLSKLNEGDEFEFEAEIKGDRVNIKAGTFKLTKSSPIPIATPFEAPKDHSISIEGQVCLKELGEAIRSDDAPLDLIEAYWKIIRQKLFDWTGIEIKPQPVKPPVTPTATKKEDKAQPVPTSAQVEVSKTLPTPDKITKVTGDAIVAWAKDDEMKSLIRGYMAREFKRVKVGDMTELEGKQLLEALKSGIIQKEEKS